MKKITQIALTALLFVGITANAQTQLKKGSVTYNMTMPGASEEMAAMGESTITVHFNETMQATDMSMMGGMMMMKTIVPNENKKDSKTLILELTPEIEKQLNTYVDKIEDLLEQDTIPPVLNESKCKKCAYYEYCYI